VEKCRNLRLFPPEMKTNHKTIEKLVSLTKTEIAGSLCSCNRGKANPRGVKKKMSPFNGRRRGEPLNRKTDYSPVVLNQVQPRKTKMS
ncbi:MAG: hypothetical protein LBJ61_01420, partial [Deltaproteobacteria bacterium]|nr:hypothetical protein [Deltaproteobacteria bacterium]